MQKYTCRPHKPVKMEMVRYAACKSSLSVCGIVPPSFGYEKAAWEHTIPSGFPVRVCVFGMWGALSLLLPCQSVEAKSDDSKASNGGSYQNAIHRLFPLLHAKEKACSGANNAYQKRGERTSKQAVKDCYNGHFFKPTDSPCAGTQFFLFCHSLYSLVFRVLCGPVKQPEIEIAQQGNLSQVPFHPRHKGRGGAVRGVSRRHRRRPRICPLQCPDNSCSHLCPLGKAASQKAPLARQT